MNRRRTAKPTEYAQLYLNGGDNPTFEQIDGFLYAHYNARALHNSVFSHLKAIEEAAINLATSSGSGEYIKAFNDLVELVEREQDIEV